MGRRDSGQQEGRGPRGEAGVAIDAVFHHGCLE